LKLERERGREFDLKKLRSKGFSTQQSGGGTPFYSPHMEFARWGVRNPDMSGKELRHIRKGYWNPVWAPDKSDAL
jgi:hypothetical protein